MRTSLSTALRVCSLLALPSLGLACGDDAVCGSSEEAQATIVGALGAENISWENWRSSPNNDCGETGGPISLTVEADQVMTNRGFTLCLPRPDRLSAQAVDVSDMTLIRVIDVFADVDGVDCLASLDRSMAASGTLAFPGICDDGLNVDGYDIVFDLQLPLTITCGQEAPTSEVMNLSGRAAVTATVLP